MKTEYNCFLGGIIFELNINIFEFINAKKFQKQYILKIVNIII